MIKLHDVVEANKILVALGGEDQMQRIAAASIERQLELQNRIDRALAYAASTPPNSMHARQIARILDGSITIDDELNEVTEHDRPIPRLAIHDSPSPSLASADGYSSAARPETPVRRTRGPNKPKPGKQQPAVARSGLAGRTPAQRKEFRAWATEQGYDLPKQGPIAVELVQEYDDAMAEARRARAAARKAERDSEGQLPI